jgi:cobalamin biosynthesis protein CobT
VREQRADLFDISVLQREIIRRASDAGLSATFVDGLEAPHFDWVSKNIAVPMVKPGSHTMEEMDYLRGSIIHEIGHSNRVDTIKRASAAKLDMSKPFGRILNMVEDGAMERGIANTWYGDAVSLGKGHDIHVRRQLDQIAKLKADNPGAQFSDEDSKTNAVYLLGERHRNWDRWSEASRERLKTEIPTDAVGVADTLDKAGWGRRMALARTTDDVFDIAKSIYKELFPDDDKDPEDKDSSQNKQGENGKAEEGTGKEGEKSKDKTPQNSPNTIDWKMLTSKHHEEGAPNAGAKVDYSSHRYRRGGTLMPVEIKKPTPRRASAPPVPPFVGRLRILLQSEKKSKFEFGLTSGRLDQRKLAKLALPVVPGSDSWRHVFKKRVPGRKINTAVQIMVDGSGSMSGHKNEIASDAADMLCQAFAGPLRIKTAVHGFDASSGNNNIYPLKEFGENVLPGVIAGRSRGVGFSGNADGDAVIWALGNIIHRPEKRKIIIVLSDGMPTDGTHVVDPGSMLKFAIETARKRGVQVYGIGIEDRSVQHFYGADCKTITSADQLPQAILDTLKTRV